MDLVSEPGKTEVGHNHLTASIQHDVGGLQVAMQHAFGMSGREPGAELASDVGGLILRQTADASQ